MLKTSTILNANKEIMVLNMVKFNKWENREIKKHFNDKIEYYSNILCDKDMNIQEIKKYLINYIEELKDNENFDKFIEVLKSQEIKKINNKKLLEIHDLNEYFNNWNEIQNFILNEILLNLED